MCVQLTAWGGLKHCMSAVVKLEPLELPADSWQPAVAVADAASGSDVKPPSPGDDVKTSPTGDGAPCVTHQPLFGESAMWWNHAAAKRKMFVWKKNCVVNCFPCILLLCALCFCVYSMFVWIKIKRYKKNCVHSILPSIATNISYSF